MLVCEGSDICEETQNNRNVNEMLQFVKDQTYLKKLEWSLCVLVANDESLAYGDQDSLDACFQRQKAMGKGPLQLI